MSRQFELLLWKEWGERFKWNTVSELLRSKPIDVYHLGKDKEFLVLSWRTHPASDGISSLEPIKAYLLLKYHHIVWRGQIIEIRRTQEPIAFGHQFENAFDINNPLHFKWITLKRLLVGLYLCLRIGCTATFHI